MLLYQEFVNVILCFLFKIPYSHLVDFVGVHETNPESSLPTT